VAGPSRYNRKLKAKNDRRKARASRGGRTASEAGLGRSMAASGRKVSRTNRAAGKPIRSLPKSGRSPVRVARVTPRKPDYGSMTLSELASQSNVPKKYRTAARASRTTGLSKKGQDARIVDKQGRELSAGQKTLQAADFLSTALPAAVGGVGGAVASTTVKQGGKAAAKAVVKAIKGSKKSPPKPKPKPKPKSPKAQKKADRKKVRKEKRNKKRARKQARGVVARSPYAGTAGATYAIGKSQPDLKPAKDAATFIEGTVEAPVKDPAQYSVNTAKALAGLGAGFVQVPWALGKSGGRAVSTGVNKATGGKALSDFSGKQIASPITDPASAIWKGTKEAAKEAGSGDKEKVIGLYNNPEGGIGGIGFVPLGRAALGVTRSGAWRGTRSKVREKAEQRSQRQGKERAAAREAAEKGRTPTAKDGVRAKRKSRKERRREKKDAQPEARDSYTSPRERYVFQGAGRRREDRRTRKDAPEAATFEQQSAIRWTALDKKDIDQATASVRVPRGVDDAEAYRRNAQAIAFLGLDSSMPSKAGPALKRWADDRRGTIEKPTGRLPEGQPIPRRLIDWIEKNPEVLSDPAFQKMRGIAKKIFEAEERIRPDGTWPSRKTLPLRRGPIAQAKGIPEPRELAAQGVRVRRDGKKRTVKTEYSTPDTVRRARAGLRSKLAEARTLDRRARAETDPSKAKALIDDSLAARAEARTIARKLEDTKTAKLRAEQIVEQRMRKQVIEPEGFEVPVRVPHVERVTAREGLPAKVARDRSSQRGPSEQVGMKMNEFRLLPQNRADFSVESVMGAVGAQRLQRAQNRFTQQMVAQHYVPVRVRGRGKVWATSDEIVAAVKRGDLPSEGVVLLDKQFASAALKEGGAGKGWTVQQMADATTPSASTLSRAKSQGIKEAPDFGRVGKLPEGGDTAVSMREVLRAMNADELENLLVKGHKYAVVREPAAREIMAQAGSVSNGIVRFATAANRGTSTAILGYNPSWFGAQQIAEGGPALIAAGINPARWGRMRRASKAIKGMDNETRAAVEANYGQAGGIFQIPRAAKGGKPSKLADIGEPAVTPKAKMYRALKMMATGRAINEAVLKTGGWYRRMAYLAKLDKDFPKLTKGLGNALLIQEKAAKATGNSSLASLAAYISKNPRLRAQYQRYMTDVMGEWVALSSRERNFAPFVAFYPYVRYSLKWGVWSFPKQHPFKATALWYLAALNAQELERLVDNGKVADWLSYAFPVVWEDGEAKVLPGGTRFTPMMSSLVEGIGDGNIVTALGTLNPAVKTALFSTLGLDSFSAEKVATEGWSNTHTDGPLKVIPPALLERFLLAASALLAMGAPVRAVDQATDWPIRNIKPRKAGQETVIGGRGSGSKRFQEIEGRGKAVERTIAPWSPLSPMSAEDFRKRNALKIEMDERYNPKKKARRKSGSSGSSSAPKTPWWR